MEKVDSQGLTEQEFLLRYAQKQYAKPSLTADMVVLSEEKEKCCVLLVKRKNHPFLGCWALPGGFANPRERIEETAARELREETGIPGLTLQPVGLFSQPGRDPRGWVVTQAYYAIADRSKMAVHPGDDAGEAGWFQITAEAGKLQLTEPEKKILLPEEDLAFDHKEILRAALACAGIVI